MSSLINIHKEGEREFLMGCNTNNISDPPSDTKWLKSHIKERELAMLRGVMEWAENQKTSYSETDMAGNGFNIAMSAIRGYCQEQIKLIEEDK
jgi:hypothetical protein